MITNNSSHFLVYICLTIFINILSASCVHQRIMTRDEWLSLTTRSYENISKDELISKAEQVLRLIDGDDFMITHNPDGFTATRDWIVYLVFAGAMGTDFWQFTVKEDGNNNLKVSISISTTAGGLAATSNNSITTIPSNSTGINGTAVYETFWQRLNYLLGKTDTWFDCGLVEKKVYEKELWGDSDPICSDFNTNNDLPPNISESEKQRIASSKSKETVFHD